MRIPRSSLSGLDRDYGTMTPMIDVVFNLLIFFVIGAGGFAAEKLLATKLASSGGTSPTAQPVKDEPAYVVHVTLKLFRDDNQNVAVDMNGTVYSDRAKLKEQLRALADVGPENPINLDTAKDVPLGDMIDVYDTCRAAGFTTINFVAGKSGEPRD
jgi:biopolymer transport protein ExbD